jgi:hypothetical protein
MCLSLLVNQLALMGRGDHGRRSSAVDLELLIDFLSGGLDAALRPSAINRPAARRRTA